MSRPEKGLHFLMINPVLSLHSCCFLQRLKVDLVG